MAGSRSLPKSDTPRISRRWSRLPPEAAHVDPVFDADNVVRRVPMVKLYRGAILPGALARHYPRGAGSQGGSATVRSR